MKSAFTMTYHSGSEVIRLPRARVAELLKAARSRGATHRPKKQPSGDILLPCVATIFRKR